MQFVLDEIVDLAAMGRLDAFSESGLEAVPEVMAEAAKFFAEVIAPTNRVGDVQGSVLGDDGTVTTPEGFREAYRQYVDGGWAGLASNPEFGGAGMPFVVAVAVLEMLTSANVALSLNPVLTQAAVHALEAHGSEQQKSLWLPRLVTGEWSGTMVLTEPHAGSDVGALTTRAEPRDDGSYLIKGQKIYITWGDHDLTENIVHLVIARTPGAPPGTKGLSLFLVPKFLVDDDGGIGGRNDITCISLEHKMGLHGSPTCVLQFGDDDGAVGYRIGEEQSGMRYMFTMMNHARLSVGLEGLAVAERAYQAALAYALERRQGRRPDTEPGASARIVEHPNVRRMLMTMKARIEALRCLIYRNAAALDMATHAPTESDRRHNRELADLLTPLSKAWGTDLGIDIANTAIQVHGGIGYIEETGVAQLVRDIRIAAIYEGTNGIQAIDLVGRKLSMRDGEMVMDVIGEMDTTVRSLVNAGLTEIADRLELAAADLRAASRWLLDKGGASSDDGLAGATPYLEMFGTTIGGWLLGESALAAKRRLAESTGADRRPFLEAKVATAGFYARQLLPRVHGLLPAVTAGADSVYAVPEADLG
jgi:alkylation response protein AidB-like acyl-CoA dehydrogenase